MRLLFVEDQQDFVDKKLPELSKTMSVSFFDASRLDASEHKKSDCPVETQIANIILSMEELEGQFDAILLDTDLSGIGLGNGISQSAFRSACSTIGLPVLRYSKKGLTQPSERLKYLATIAREGSQAILVPDNILQDALANWIEEITQSFKRIREKIEETAKDNRVLSPAELLSEMLAIPDIDIDLMGYAGANFFFFGDLIESPKDSHGQLRVRNYATQLGYWLANYVLMFPGPILNESATAAYLGITENDIKDARGCKLLDGALYKGPFSATRHFYVKRQLDNILLNSEADSFVELLVNDGIRIENATATDHGQLWNYCVVSDKPVLQKDARGPFDWIPRGAEICRVQKDIYDKFGPWLNV